MIANVNHLSCTSPWSIIVDIRVIEERNCDGHWIASDTDLRDRRHLKPTTHRPTSLSSKKLPRTLLLCDRGRRSPSNDFARGPPSTEATEDQRTQFTRSRLRSSLSLCFNSIPVGRSFSSENVTQTRLFTSELRHLTSVFTPTHPPNPSKLQQLLLTSPPSRDFQIPNNPLFFSPPLIHRPPPSSTAPLPDPPALRDSGEASPWPPPPSSSPRPHTR